MPTVKDVGEPCEGEPHARFDGGREETNASRSTRTTPGASRLPDRSPPPTCTRRSTSPPARVIAEMRPRHRAEEFRRFLNLIDASVPADLDVHVVLDNSSTHKTPSIQRWLVRHPRFTLHFTPTYSSWLNLVERWFAELTTKWIKRGAHRSVRDLVASIRTWIANWNDDPKPFVWHKTADQILDSLAAYFQRINDSRTRGSL
jgi:transposase